MGEILCLSKSQQNLPACASTLLSEMNFMLFCELFLWELSSFRHPVLCTIHNVFSRHRAYSIAPTWELRGLCVWVFMLDVFWSWTLCQIHKCIGFHSALLHLHFLWLTWKKFLLEGKNGAHCIVTGVNKTDFDRHIVWMLAGLFFSFLSLSPFLPTKETDTPPTPPSADFSHSHLVLLQILPIAAATGTTL